MGILFTAFEPSGDALAARMIEVVRRRRPQLQIWALGGPLMRQAGAELIETSTQHAVMMAGILSQARVHHQRLNRLKRWLADHPIAAVVPVDSPAANWSICKLVRRCQPEAKVVHLAAPQVWGWARWRVHKLRRLTNQVLCLLPFEPEWFAQHNIPTTFVGHPLYDPPPDPATWADQAAQLPQGDGAKLALLPGSRHAEIKANWPTMLGALKQLRQRHAGLSVVVAALNESVAAQVKELTEQLEPTLLEHIHIEVDRINVVLSWAEAAIVVSGTATLHTAAFGVPMVVLYEVSRPAWYFVGRWLIKSQHISLPNLILANLGQPALLCELMPNFHAVQPLVEHTDRLLVDSSAAEAQKQAFQRIKACFSEVGFGDKAVQALFAQMG